MNDEHPHEEMNIYSERSTSLTNFVWRTSSSSGSESDSSLMVSGETEHFLLSSRGSFGKCGFEVVSRYSNGFQGVKKLEGKEEGGV